MTKNNAKVVLCPYNLVKALDTHMYSDGVHTSILGRDFAGVELSIHIQFNLALIPIACLIHVYSMNFEAGWTAKSGWVALKRVGQL